MIIYSTIIELLWQNTFTIISTNVIVWIIILVRYPSWFVLNPLGANPTKENS